VARIRANTTTTATASHFSMDAPPVDSGPRLLLLCELRSIQHFRCPQCGTATSEIVAGRDIQLTALEVIDDGAAAHR
jgi:hypothetical protein